MLFLYGCLRGLPLNAERRIGDDIIELIARELVVAKGISLTHVLGIAALDERVGLGNGKGLVVQLLTITGDLSLGVYLQKALCQTTQHLTGAHGHVVDGSRDALVLQLLFVVANKQVGHEVDDIAGGEVGSGLLVVTLGELAHQFLEDVTHVHTRHLVGTKVGLRRTELLYNEIEHVIVGHLLELTVEVHTLDDVYHVLREVVEVRLKVGLDILGVIQESLECEGRKVIELLLGGRLQESLLHDDTILLELGIGLKNILLGRSECVVETLDNAHWEYDVAILMWLINPYQLIGDCPNKVGLLLYVNCGLLLYVVSHKA